MNSEVSTARARVVTLPPTGPPAGAACWSMQSGGIAPRTLAAAARKLAFSSAATVVAPSATVVAFLAANLVIRYKAVWLRPRIKDTHTHSVPCPSPVPSLPTSLSTPSHLLHPSLSPRPSHTFIPSSFPPPSSLSRSSSLVALSPSLLIPYLYFPHRAPRGSGAAPSSSRAAPSN